MGLERQQTVNIKNIPLKQAQEAVRRLKYLQEQNPNIIVPSLIKIIEQLESAINDVDFYNFKIGCKYRVLESRSGIYCQHEQNKHQFTEHLKSGLDLDETPFAGYCNRNACPIYFVKE